MPNVTSLVDRGNFDTTNDYGVHSNLDGQPSNNPAWAVADILTNLTYGGNYDLDWDAFQEWATFCTTNNYEVNIYFDGTLSLWDAALRIARESKGILKIEGTKISVTIDEVSNPVQLFSVGNIIEGSFKEHFLPLESRANCCEVTFFNEDHNYQREQFMVYLDSWNTDNEIKTSLTLYGVTNYNQAISHAQYMLNYNKYLTRSGEFDADIDAIACTIGDIVKLQYDVPNWGYGGRIVSADANGVVLDQKIELEDGKDYKIVWRLQDDTQVEKTWTQSGTLTTNEIPLTLTDSEIPKEYDVYAVGETNLPYKLVRIVRIDRKDDLSRHIEWIEYNPSIYTDMPTFPALPDYSFDLDAKNLTVEQATYNSLSGDWNGFKLLWDKNSNVRKWKVYYKLDDSLGYGEDAFGEEFFGGVDFADNWHFYKTTYDSEIDIIFDNLYDARYTFAVCGIGAMGEQNPDAAQQVSITPVYLNRKAPFFPAGSEISGVFDTKLKIWWDNAISTALSHYEVTYLEDSVQKTVVSVNNQFLVNSPIQRSYSFSIIAVDKWGQSSEPITGSITNPIPSTPSAPTLTPQFSSIDVKWTQLSDNDIVHYNIYGGKEDNQGNYSLEKLAEIKGNSWTLMCDSGETWHFTISASDPFGEGSQSPEAVATSLSASIRNYNLGLPLTKDITFSVSNSAANWTSGTLNYKGVVYNIPSGSTTYKYIWWDLSSPNEFQYSDSRPTLSSDVWLMAYFDGTNVYPATQNKIQNAGILQASSITADLIGAGQIQTTHLAANAITAEKIATQTITADKMDVSQLSAITADLGSITAGTITMDSNGFIKGGQTSFNVGNGFYLGYDDSAYKFSVGNVDNEKYLSFDGSNLKVGMQTQVIGANYYANYDDGAYYYYTDFQSLDAFDKVIDSGGSIYTSSVGTVIKASTSSAATTYLSRGIPASIQVDIYGTSFWSKNIYLKLALSYLNVPYPSSMLILFGNPDGAYFAMEVSTNSSSSSTDGYVKGITRTYDSSSESYTSTETTLGTNIASTYANHIEIQFQQGTWGNTVHYYMLTDYGTIDTNVPGNGDDWVDTNIFYVGVKTDGSSTQNPAVQVDNYKCLIWR